MRSIFCHSNLFEILFNMFIFMNCQFLDIHLICTLYSRPLHFWVLLIYVVLRLSVQLGYFLLQMSNLYWLQLLMMMMMMNAHAAACAELSRCFL